MTTLHIGDLIRADIMARDWRDVHVRADRRDPIALADTSERRRGNRAIKVRSWGR